MQKESTESFRSRGSHPVECFGSPIDFRSLVLHGRARFSDDESSFGILLNFSRSCGSYGSTTTPPSTACFSSANSRSTGCWKVFLCSSILVSMVDGFFQEWVILVCYIGNRRLVGTTEIMKQGRRFHNSFDAKSSHLCNFGINIFQKVVQMTN